MDLPQEYAKTGLVPSAAGSPFDFLGGGGGTGDAPSLETLGNQARLPRHVDRSPSPSCPPLCRLYHVRADGFRPTMTSFMGVRSAIILNISVGCDEDAIGSEDIASIVLVLRDRRVRSGGRVDDGYGRWGNRVKASGGFIAEANDVASSVGRNDRGCIGGRGDRGGDTRAAGSSPGYFPNIRRTSEASTKRTLPRL